MQSYPHILLKRPWIVNCILKEPKERKNFLEDTCGQGGHPIAQILEFRKFPSEQLNIAYLHLSDGFNYASALFSPNCLSDYKKNHPNKPLARIKGALIHIVEFDLLPNRSFTDFTFFIDKISFIGSEGSFPFGESFPVTANDEVSKKLSDLKSAALIQKKLSPNDNNSNSNNKVGTTPPQVPTPVASGSTPSSSSSVLSSDMSSDLDGLKHIADAIEDELNAEDAMLADIQHPFDVPQTTNDSRKSTGAIPHPQGLQTNFDLDDCLIPLSQETKLESLAGWDKRPLQSPSSSSNNTKGNISVDTSMAESPVSAPNSIKKKRLEWADIESQDPLFHYVSPAEDFYKNQKPLQFIAADKDLPSSITPHSQDTPASLPSQLSQQLQEEEDSSDVDWKNLIHLKDHEDDISQDVRDQVIQDSPHDDPAKPSQDVDSSFASQSQRPWQSQSAMYDIIPFATQPDSQLFGIHRDDHDEMLEPYPVHNNNNNIERPSRKLDSEEELAHSFLKSDDEDVVPPKPDGPTPKPSSASSSKSDSLLVKTPVSKSPVRQSPRLSEDSDKLFVTPKTTPTKSPKVPSDSSSSSALVNTQPSPAFPFPTPQTPVIKSSASISSGSSSYTTSTPSKATNHLSPIPHRSSIQWEWDPLASSSQSQVPNQDVSQPAPASPDLRSQAPPVPSQLAQDTQPSQSQPQSQQASESQPAQASPDLRSQPPATQASQLQSQSTQASQSQPAHVSQAPATLASASQSQPAQTSQPVSKADNSSEEIIRSDNDSTAPSAPVPTPQPTQAPSKQSPSNEEDESELSEELVKTPQHDSSVDQSFDMNQFAQLLSRSKSNTDNSNNNNNNLFQTDEEILLKAQQGAYSCSRKDLIYQIFDHFTKKPPPFNWNAFSAIIPKPSQEGEEEVIASSSEEERVVLILNSEDEFIDVTPQSSPNKSQKTTPSNKGNPILLDSDHEIFSPPHNKPPKKAYSASKSQENRKIISPSPKSTKRNYSSDGSVSKKARK